MMGSIAKQESEEDIDDCGSGKVRKGLWSPDEDERLRNHILQYGYQVWSSVPKRAGLRRTGKSCRLRWMNYLRPELKHGKFSEEEEEVLIRLHELVGNRWAYIAAQLPGRTDNDVKNHWNSRIRFKSSSSESSLATTNESAVSAALEALPAATVEALFDCTSEDDKNFEQGMQSMTDGDLGCVVWQYSGSSTSSISGIDSSIESGINTSSSSSGSSGIRFMDDASCEICGQTCPVQHLNFDLCQSITGSSNSGDGGGGLSRIKTASS